MLSMIFITIILAKASISRVVEVFETEPEIKSPDISKGEKLVPCVKDGTVEFKNVDFSYLNDEKKCVLKNINLKIQSGQMVGIIGGTGSSKTTLVSLIPRLYDCLKGEVLVSGENVKNYNLKDLRDSVSVVLQKNVLFSGTIKENLMWGNENASMEEIEEACGAADILEFISSMPEKFETNLGQGGVNLSGGQKQRLCIARALLKKPKILILDDSTSAVDTATDSRIRAALRNCLPDTTKIIIAQRISSVKDADLIFVLDEGKLNGFGNHEELLLNNKIYKEVYESQESKN
jgi:ATP-binding cassette subfamily B protein